jgi:hypothetical protein
MGETAENTLMDDLSAAWDEAVEEENTDEVSHEAEDQQQNLADTEGEPDESSGGPEEQPSGGTDPELVSGGKEESGIAASGDNDKPPVGLSPAAREAWADVPDAVKAEITKREQDYEKGIMKYSQNAKRAEAMDRTLQPFQQLFAMNGGPGQTLPGLLQTASLLQMGTQAQKAQTVANLIQQFGVDIKTLDGVLVGEQPAPEQQQPNIQQILDQRIAQYHQQQQAAQQTAYVNNEVESFAADPKHEFYADVKMDMADLLDMAGNRGVNMTLQEAYDRAIAMNPQISKIIAARESRAATQQKSQAAVSISGSPSGPGDASAPKSTRAALEEAWENAGRT